MAKYGISDDLFLRMFATGHCHCCGRVFKSAKDTNVDHNHKTGVVRGLLCTGCNTAIGKLGDSARGVERALRYLIRAEGVSEGEISIAL